MNTSVEIHAKITMRILEPCSHRFYKDNRKLTKESWIYRKVWLQLAIVRAFMYILSLNLLTLYGSIQIKL